MSTMKKAEFERETARLTDRTSDVRACVGRIADAWSYDLDKRSFGPAYLDPDSGAYTTELDLAVVMSALMKRGAVIKFPKAYKGRRAATRTEGEILTSKENRHGRILNLVSNAKVWSFNVMFDDVNVMTTDEVGKPRNFMMQDLDGTWHDAWSPLVFISKTDAEKKLFKNTESVTVNYFVHPLRWPSIYGRPYLAAKIAIMRLMDQDRFLKAEQKRIREACEIEPKQWAKSTKVGAEKKISVWAFESLVDGVEFAGEYETYRDTREGLEDSARLRKRIGQLLTQLRFHVRCTEFAFWQEAVCKPLTAGSGNGVLIETDDARILDWLKGAEVETGIAGAEGEDADFKPRKPSWCVSDWETGYKETPRARTHWARLVRDNGYHLRWRCWIKSENVAA